MELSNQGQHGDSVLGASGTGVSPSAQPLPATPAPGPEQNFSSANTQQGAVAGGVTAQQAVFASPNVAAPIAAGHSGVVDPAMQQQLQPPAPSTGITQTNYPAANTKRMITLIIFGLVATSVVGSAIAYTALRSTTSPSSTVSQADEGGVKTTDFTVSTLQGDAYRIDVPEGWFERGITNGLAVYTDGETDSSSSVSLSFSTEPITTIPDFELFSSSNLDDFSSGFMQGLEKSFNDAAEEAGSRPESISVKRVEVSGSSLAFEYDYAGTNSVNRQIKGKGRYLTTQDGRMYTTVVEAIASVWDDSEAELVGLINSYRVN